MSLIFRIYSYTKIITKVDDCSKFKFVLKGNHMFICRPFKRRLPSVTKSELRCHSSFSSAFLYESGVTVHHPFFHSSLSVAFFSPGSNSLMFPAIYSFQLLFGLPLFFFHPPAIFSKLSTFLTA